MLNEGTERGDAAGFRLDSLAALPNLKQTLDAPAATVSEQRPELLEVAKDVPLLGPGSRAELEDVEVEIGSLARSLTRVLQAATDSGLLDSGARAPSAPTSPTGGDFARQISPADGLE